MKILTITRQPSTDSGTFGQATTGDGYSWYTLELPWLENQPDVSCIPLGTYTAKLQYSPHFETDLYHLIDVPNREAVEIHSGNFAGNKLMGLDSDVLGCVLVGKMVGSLNNSRHQLQPAILSSKAALTEMMDWADGEDLQIVITQ